jgi:ABC-type polysaccharide/polyol phosphate transport system ATPase subunit
MAAAAIVEDLGVAYRPKSRHGWARKGEPRWAVSDVSFSVARGELLGVIGGNGSGKTTLLRSLAGVLRPNRGRVAIAGRVASVIDLTPGLGRDLAADEDLALWGSLLGLSRAEMNRRRDAIVAFSGLDEDVLTSPLYTLSAGMTLRLQLGVAFHVDPDLLVVDEVLAVGDEDFRAACLDRIDLLRAEGGAAVLASHDPGLVARCDRVLVLEHGAPVFLGDPLDALEYHDVDVVLPAEPGERAVNR